MIETIKALFSIRVVRRKEASRIRDISVEKLIEQFIFIVLKRILKKILLGKYDILTLTVGTDMAKAWLLIFYQIVKLFVMKFHHKRVKWLFQTTF